MDCHGGTEQMKSMNLTSLAGALLLTILICAGFWFYTQWDTKRFEASLSKDSSQTGLYEPASVQQATHLQEATETIEIAATENPGPGPELEISESDATEQEVDVDVAAEDPTNPADLNTFFEEFLEETVSDAVVSGDFTDVDQDVPYDQDFVKAGFDAYNAALKTDPEYAYQRLDEAFREQYGDDPDVDIIVESIRRSNEGTHTIDTAIDSAEAILRLASKISPPEALENLEFYLEFLMEIKQLALEQGTEITLKTQDIIGE